MSITSLVKRLQVTYSFNNICKINESEHKRNLYILNFKLFKILCALTFIQNLSFY